MSKGKSASKLVPFDAARCLADDAAVAEYVTAVLEADDPPISRRRRQPALRRR
jgi:DNA-binding phage protein